MTNASSSDSKRVDSASRVIAASPQTIFQAFINPDALISWLPPEGMSGHVHEFSPRAGGSYRMTLTYDKPEHAGAGKTSEIADVVKGRFLEVVPDTKIVQEVEFESDDPAFAGTMILTWSLMAVPGGTDVTIRCEDVPIGIRPEDHEAGLQSTLMNLAAFVERK